MIRLITNQFFQRNALVLDHPHGVIEFPAFQVEANGPLIV